MRRLRAVTGSPFGSSVGCAAVLTLVACGGDKVTNATPQSPADSATSIAIDQQGFFTGQIKLDVREQATLTATVRDSSGTVLPGHSVTWSSSAPGVATVSSAGVVTGVGPGDATITAMTNGKSDTRSVQVLALDLTAFQLTTLVTDDAGMPIPGARVYEEYYGARPSGCLSCNIPYGNYVAGTADSTGAFTGHFVAAPEAMDAWAGGEHAFAYVVTARANYETDRRFVLGTATSFTQPVHLHAMQKATSGDSVTLSIAPTDPVYQELDTSPASSASIVCRSVHVLAAADGVLQVNAVPADASLAAPYLELDSPDESRLFAFAQGTVSKTVHAGEVVEVRVATTIKPGAPAQSFVLHTALAP